MGNKRKLLEIEARFGSLVVLEQAEAQVYGKQRHTAYKCQCDCGNVVVIRAATLRDGQKTCKKCHGGKFKGDGSQRKLLEIGERFGSLVVLEQVEDIGGNTVYKCQCNCGNVVVAQATRLRADRQRCQRCSRRETGSRRKLIELGTRFGSLVVVERAEDVGKEKATAYKCQCECGNTTVVRAHRLRDSQRACRNCSTKLPRGEAGFNAYFKTYKSGAKRRGLVFELTKDEFRKLVTSDCAYCGTLPCSIHHVNHAYYGDAGAHGDFTHNGVDRMDNDLGYTPSNVVPCCKWCNRAKGDMDYDRWIAWLDQLAKFRSTLKLSDTLDKTSKTVVQFI